MITLYTIDCPKCRILEDELTSQHIEFEVCKDKKLMIDRGMVHLPILQINDNTYLNFKEAMKWIEDIKWQRSKTEGENNV